MKKLIALSLFTVLTFCAYAQGFTVKGNIKGAGNCRIEFVRVTMNNDMITDTIEVKNDKFIFKGEVEHPTRYSAMVRDCKALGEGFYYMSFYIENSNINVTGDIRSSKSIVVKGSASNDEHIAVGNLIEPEAAKFRKLRVASSDAFKAKDNKKQDEVSEEMKEVLVQIKDKLLAIPNYSTSIIIPGYINEYFSASSSPQFMDEITAGFDKSIHNNPMVKYLIEDNKREKTVKDGMMAKNFELKDLEGNTYRLSDFKGKYVLLEFSASWCGWCKLEVPFLKEVFEITKDKDDFVMFTVNLDTKRELWAEEADVPWKTIGDLKGSKDGIARDYNIHGVPMIYLISPEGKIVSRKLRREELVQYFKDKYSKEVRFEELTVNQALQKSKERNKLLFVDCYTSWCGPCKQMDETVFKQEIAGDYFNNEFVNIKIDMEKGEGPAFGKKYNVKAYPTFLILDSNGKEVARVLGGHQMGEFIDIVKDGIAYPIADMHERYEKGEVSKEFLVKYIQSLAASYDFKKKNEVLDKLCKLYNRSFTSEDWVIFSKFLGGYDTYAFNYLLNNRKKVDTKFGSENVEKKITSILSPSVFNMLNSTLSGDIKYDAQKYKELCGVVARSKSSEKNYFETNLKFLKYYEAGDVANCIKLFEDYYANTNDEQRFSAMLHMNMATIKKGNKNDCENTLRVIGNEVKKHNISTEDGLFKTVINGLENKIKSF